MWLRTCYYIIVIVIVESFLALMIMNLIYYSCYYIIAELLLPLLIMDLIILTLLLSHCFLWSSWIWLYHHSCYYNFAESLLPLLIMNLIKLLFTSLHYYWVIAISENQEFDSVIDHRSLPWSIGWVALSFLVGCLSRYGDTRPNLTSTYPTPPNPYIFWKLMIIAIQKWIRNTNTKTKTNTKTMTKTKTSRE